MRILKMLAVGAVLGVVGAASATISASWDFWSEGTLPDSGERYWSFRFYVDVSTTPGDPDPEDDWTAAGMTLEMSAGTIYHDPVDDGNPPNPAFFPFVPDAEFTSYYTSPADYPNTEYDGAVVGIAVSDDTDTSLATDWFDTHETGNGHWVIAQITILPDETGYAYGDGVLLYAAADTGGELFVMPFFGIPEPGTLALVALGGCALLRRRE